MARLTSEFWVKALLRKIFGDGGFAAIERSGSPEAGAVFVRVLHRDGSQTLFGPAPQSMFDPDAIGERLFERRIRHGSQEEADGLLQREMNFDPDLWVVELETDAPETYIEVTPDEPDV